MSFPFIPEKQIEPYPDFFAAPKAGKTIPPFELILEKLFLIESLSLEELRELNRLLEALGIELRASGKESVSSHEEFIRVLTTIYKDPGHALHRALLRFMQEHIPFLTAKSGAEKEVIPEKGLSALLGKVAEWQARFKEGSPEHLFAQKLLDGLHTQETVDVKGQVQSNGRESLKAALHPAQFEGSFEMHSFLGQIQEKARSYLNAPSASFDAMQFIQTVLLPKIESWIAQHLEKNSEGALEENTAANPLSQEPSHLQAKGEEHPFTQQAVQEVAKYLSDTLGGGQEEMQGILKEILGAGTFPVIQPYPSLFPPERRLTKKQRRQSPFTREKFFTDEEGEDTDARST